MSTNVQPLAAARGAAGGAVASSAPAGFDASQLRSIQQFGQNFGVTDGKGFQRDLQGVLSAAHKGDAAGVRAAVQRLVGFLEGQGAQARPTTEPGPGFRHCGHHNGHGPAGPRPNSATEPGHQYRPSQHAHRHSHHGHGHKNHGQAPSAPTGQPAQPGGVPGIPPGVPNAGHDKLETALRDLLRSLLKSHPAGEFHQVDNALRDAMKTYQPAPQHATQGQAADLSNAAPLVRAA